MLFVVHSTPSLLLLFVKSVGFGALAGILTLIVASIGFIAKLFAEAIEEISLKQVEAIRATGANFIAVILFSVMPQVFSRFIGFSTYQLDSNLRNSTMVGIVGAGGLGGTLFSAFQRFDYDFVAAILITIISLIFILGIFIHISPEGISMSHIDYQWERFTLWQKLGRYSIYLTFVIAMVLSLRSVEFIPEFLFDAPEQMADMFSRMWPLDYGFYQTTVHTAIIETLNIATLGTLVTLIFAIPLALINASNIVASPWLHWISRFFLVSSRSVNSLVWALLFVAIFGPGSIAGILTIAFRSIGFIGKLLGEAIEEISMGSVEALRATGAPWGAVLLKGYWPQVMPAFFSIVLFRWDINVRESAVLGLVGAGGIGVVLSDVMNLFEWQQVSVALLTIFVVVIMAEIVVVSIRKRLI